jgi:signal transduction histidine kinase
MRLSIATKIFLGFTAILVTSALVSAYGILRMRRIGQGLELVTNGYFPLTRAAGSLEAFQKERTRSTDRLIDERDPAVRRGLINLDVRDFAKVMSEKLARTRELVQVAQTGASAVDREALQRIDARLVSLGDDISAEEQAALALDAALKAPEAQTSRAPAELPEERELVARLKAAERRVNNDIKLLLDVIQGQMSRGVSEAERQEQTTRIALVALSLVALGVGLLITLFSQRALAPIRGLTAVAQRLGRGSPDAVAAVPERGGDELSLLAREFNAMAQRLAARERELKAQSEALLRSERLAAIGRIAAQITHEIRNPLSAIGLNAEELGERLRETGGGATAGGAAGAAGAVALCDAIAREVDRLAAVTEEYLRFARLPKPQLAETDVSEVVRDLIDFVRPELSAERVRLAAQLAPEVLTVLADQGQIRQLLLNLLRNAKEAMHGGGELRVATRLEGSWAVVEVRDSGPGIPAVRLARIFDPFFTTKERGTGLGLALSQEIAQEHGGDLTCQSQVGEGATFTLRLPAQQASGARPGSGARTPQAGGRAGLPAGVAPEAETEPAAARAAAVIAPS